ncbi:MAG: hypothetical protein KDE14_01515 [Rhodobacteraceae bacterium]|nr:hypothetical protein [Paracoccaceae bacterium]
MTVPRQCQRLARPVPDPGARVGDDGFDIAARYKGAFHKANRRLDATRRCEDKQADRFARGGR